MFEISNVLIMKGLLNNHDWNCDWTDIAIFVNIKVRLVDWWRLYCNSTLNCNKIVFPRNYHIHKGNILNKYIFSYSNWAG